MSIVTSQQLTKYYEQYKSVDVTFNKQIVSALGLVTKGVYLKIQDRQLPCMVFSSSLSTARVIANMPATVMTALKQANNRLALRWCFKLPDKLEPITFFVTCHPAAFTHYAVQGPDVQFVSLEFTQRPPDDLIQILGSLLEANANAQRRKDERIVLTTETMKKLGLESREAALVLANKTVKCVLRDLSFSGAKVVVSGAADAYTGRTVSLKFARSDEMPEMIIPAAVRRVEEIGGRKDILAVSMEYSSDPPTSYKLLINSYVSTIRKSAPVAGSAAVDSPGEAAAAGTGAPADSPPVSPEAALPDASIPDEGDPSEGLPGTNPVNG